MKTRLIVLGASVFVVVMIVLFSLHGILRAGGEVVAVTSQQALGFEEGNAIVFAAKKTPDGFTQTYEITLDYVEANPARCCVDFETGRRIGLPLPANNESTEKVIEWFADSDADIIANFIRGKVGLGSFHMKLIKANEGKWEEYTPEGIKKELEKVDIEDISIAKPLLKELPMRYLFQTRTGTTGVLEVVSGTEKNTTLQYMLVKGPVTQKAPSTRP